MTTRLRGRSFADGAITSAKIAADAVTADKIPANAIGSSELDLTANYTFTGTVSGAGGGNVVEMLSGVCDGRTVTVPSGSYTLQNVNAEFPLTTSYQDVTGSVLSYTPPSGTKVVVYRYQCSFDSEGYSGISHFKFFIDSDEVIPAYRSLAPGEYVSQAHHNSEYLFEWPIQCDAGSDDAANGKFASWTSAKTLKLSAREYGGSYAARLHHNVWRNGDGAASPYNLAVPTLTIIALK